jgi:anti-anti-sigma factor
VAVQRGNVCLVARPFAVSTQRTAATLTITVQGELDGASVGELTSHCDDAMELGVTDVVLDCRALDFVDSKGIGGLLELKRCLEEAGGVLVLFAPSPTVRQTLEVTRLDQVFTVVDA